MTSEMNGLPSSSDKYTDTPKLEIMKACLNRHNEKKIKIFDESILAD